LRLPGGDNGHTSLYDDRVLELADLARELQIDARTLRRAAADGTIRCERTSARKQSLDKQEWGYVTEHWYLLSTLRRALRTEPNVRLAVLYGSAARGNQTPESDLDLLVSLAEDRPDAAVKLAVRVERATGQPVDVARINRVQSTAPLLLLQAIDEGRVLLDRDGEWAGLTAHREELARRAQRAHEARRRRARASMRELLAAES
jgi:predicted nucleotidyltransferase